MGPRGKINLIAIVVLGAIAYGLWWVVTFSGVYLDNLDVRDAVVSAFNESGRNTDERLTVLVLARLNATTLGSHEEDDGYGTIREVPGLGVKPEAVTILRDDVRKTIRISVEYRRKVVLKPGKSVKWVTFRVAKEGAIPPQ